MKLFNKIKENKKSIIILGILIFNIPLAFGLAQQVKAAIVNDGASYQTILNTPSSQGWFSIIDPTTAEQSLGCKGGALLNGDVNNFASSLGTITVGGDYQTPACIESTSGSVALNDYFNNRDTGILNTVSNVQATLLQQRPLSATSYIEQKVYALQNTGAVYAADAPTPAAYFPNGTGYQLLQPIQAFWGWSVNIVYGFLILIIIGIAFAIIFRDNINGEGFVRIQNAIPSIALAMILVPLSYAISGVFIDLITVGTNAVHAFLLGPGSPGQSVYDNRNAAGIPTDGCTTTTDNPCDRGLYADDDRVNWFNIQKMIDISNPVKNAVLAVPDPTNNSVPLVNNFFVFDIVKTILNLFSGKSQSSAYWFGQIINVVIGLTMIWIGLKILWKLFQKYLMLILMPIISPFIFATAAVPGNGTKSIVEYIKMMASGSLFFIVTYAMFLLTIIFTSSAFQNQAPGFSTGAFIPPLMGFKDVFSTANASNGTNGLALSQFIFTLIGLGIYFSIPKTLENIDAALGVKNAIPAFIQTPLDSFRDSAKVTYRGAPAFAARATQITAGGAFRTASTARNFGFNARVAYDKARGFADDDPRSATYQRRQSNIRRRQELLSALDSTENPVERAKIQANLSRLDASEALQGKNFSTKGEEGKDRKIKTTVQYLNPNDVGAIRYNFLRNDLAEMRDLLDRTKIASNRTLHPNSFAVINGILYVKRTIAKIVIEPENFEFPTRTNVFFGGIEKDPAGVERYKSGAALATTEVSSPLDEFQQWHGPNGDLGSDIIASKFFEYTNSEPVPNGSNGNWLTIRPTKPSDTQDQASVGGKKLEVTIDLYIDTIAHNFDELFKSGTGIIAKGIQTPKRGVKVGPYTYNMGRISIGVGNR